MRDAFVAATTKLLEEDSRTVVVLAEISAALFADASDRFPGRVVNVGIREQLMVGVAAGFALAGYIPIVHTYAPFLVERAFEQLKLDFGHQGLAGVFVSVGASRDAAAAGRTHQAPEDVALITSLPGWTVSVPGHAEEVGPILTSAVRSKAPWYIRLSEQHNSRPYETGPTGWSVVHAGDGDRPTIVAVGPMIDLVLEALGDARVTVVASNRPVPVDEDLLRAEVGESVFVVEPYLEGSTLSHLARVLGDTPRRYAAVGFTREETRYYGTLEDHLRDAGLDVAGLRSRLGGIV